MNIYIKSSKFIFFVNVFAILIFCILHSCKKEKPKTILTNSNLSNQFINATITGIGSEGLMEFAPQTENPYSIPNMQQALQFLKDSGEFECDYSRFIIRPTHKYIRFKPVDSSHLETLLVDTCLILFDYPLDRKLIKGGTYYRDINIPEGQPNYKWCCVAYDKVLPSNVPYDLLSELYLPEQDPKLVEFYNTPFDGCINMLIDRAMIQTGNFDTTQKSENFTQPDPTAKLKILPLPDKWTPRGNITMFDDSKNTTIGLRGVKVRVHRWFETREALTNSSGYFSIGQEFRYPVDYSIKWERNDFEIRHKQSGQAYFNGPHQKGDWNLQINSGYSRFYAIIHRAAHRYYYEFKENLKSPPLKSQMIGRLTIGAFDWNEATLNGDCRMWVRVAWDEIRIFNPGNRNCVGLFSTTIHELAHASHWNLGSHSEFLQSGDKVAESWARGVQWALTRLEYPTYQGGATLRDNYTQVVVDMIDDQNDESNPGNNGWNFNQGDSVTGYTIKQIEDALKSKTSWTSWKDNIKSKYNNATKNKLDALFEHWN